MTEMVDRVARAFAGVDNWVEADDGTRDIYRSGARAAIGAMRYPTQRMIDAGTVCGVLGALDYPVSKIIWMAMCDIALGVPTIAEAKREGKYEFKVQ